MSLVDLVILGLTAGKDQSAYDLVKEMQFRCLQEWIPISEQAIYKNTKKLEESGYLTNYEAGKKMYRITDKGREYFIELMKKQIKEENLYYINFAPVLMNIRAIPPEAAKDIIHELTERFGKNINEYEVQFASKQNVSPIAASLLKLYMDIQKLMNTWLKEFTENLNITERGE